MRLVAISECPTQYHVDIFRRLDGALGSDFFVLYGSRGQESGARYESWGEQVIHNKTGMLDGYRSSFVDSTRPWHVAKALKQRGVDQDSATLFHAILPTFSRTAAILSRIRGSRLLYRGSSNLRPTGGAANMARKLRDRITLAIFHEFCATGTATWSYFNELLFRRPVVFSPYCADEYVLSTFANRYVETRDHTRTTLGIGPDEFVVAFCGRLIPLKNVLRLIEAVRQLQSEEARPVRLIIAGDGPLKDQVERRLAEDPWAPRPIFLGFQDREGIGRLLCSSDALALPSDHETWGVVINEAQLLENVCLATEGVSCASDLIVPGENGTLVNPQSTDSIRAGLAELLTIHAQGRFIEVNRKLSQTFSSEAATEGILAAIGATREDVYSRRPPGMTRSNSGHR